MYLLISEVMGMNVKYFVKSTTVIIAYTITIETLLTHGQNVSYACPATEQVARPLVVGVVPSSYGHPSK